jgi:hypothetical protein
MTAAMPQPNTSPSQAPQPQPTAGPAIPAQTQPATQTPAKQTPAAQTPAAQTPAKQTNDPLLAFILTVLTPLLQTNSAEQAGAAARQAIAAYQATAADQLVSIAQVIGFALVSLDNLRLSMPAAMSVAMKLKLRGNANALSRSAQRATATLECQRRDAAYPFQPIPPDPAPSEPEPASAPTGQSPQILASLAAARLELQQAQAAPASNDRRIDLSWANAMADVATEFTTALPHLLPAERSNQLRRIGALAQTARALTRGEVPLRSRLLGSSAMRQAP